MAKSERCLICGGDDRPLVLDLGSTPLANAFLREEDLGRPEETYPLQVLWCQGCGLMQLSELVPPEILFSDYIYMSGKSSTIAAHNEALADQHVRSLGLAATDLVVEVASNAGSLLKSFMQRGVQVLGVEPASNLAAAANEAGVRTDNRFFDAESATELREEYGGAALLCANNVLAHVPDPVGFLRGCATLVGPGGVTSIEVPHLMTLLDGLEYDTVYHEHLSYFSMGALAEAHARAGLGIFDVQQMPVHGGSLRVLARPGAEHGGAVHRLVELERNRGMEDMATWRQFAASVVRNKEQLCAMLDRLHGAGLEVAAYGAPAKGNTLLNYCGIGADRVAFAVDRNELKVGRYTPGSRIPVREVACLKAEQPDRTLILPWNIAAEIRRQEAAYVEAGGGFIIPLPEPREWS